MALATYADLQTQIANWLARSDLTTYIPDFITLFEAAAARKLKVRPQATTTTLTPSGGVATLPTDYLGFQRVTWLGTPNHDLAYVAPSIWSSFHPADESTNIPVEFTIEGPSIKIGASNDSNIVLSYFQRTTAVSSALNWLYTNHPDAYLFGSLAEANAFDKKIDLAGVWKARRDEVFDEIAKLDFNERQGMAIRILGITP